MKQSDMETRIENTVADSISMDDIEDRYRRFGALLQGATRSHRQLVHNACLYPVWIGDSDCFFYDRTLPSGKEYRLVNAAAKTNVAAFDHQRLAKALSETLGQEVDAQHLPITVEAISLSPTQVEFTAFDSAWCYRDDTGALEKMKSPLLSSELLSPNGKQTAFLRNNNIWLRDNTSAKEHALTDDGVEHNEYAHNGSLQALWSPDSNKLFVVQTDRSQVEPLPRVDFIPADGSVRPTIDKTIREPFRGESLPIHYPKLIEINSTKITKAKYPTIVENYESFVVGFIYERVSRRTSSDRAWWSKDGQYVYFIDIPRGEQSVSVVELKAETGQTRTLFTEKTDTYIRLKPDVECGSIHHPLPDTQELIWFSERSGWGHLYLYDVTTGEVKRQLTCGDWVVRDIVHIDPTRREILIQTSGRVKDRDPYYKDIVKVNLDSGELTTLVSSDHNHACHGPLIDYMAFECLEDVARNVRGVSPSGDYLVTTQSRVDDVPVTQLFDRNGQMVMPIETADLSPLPNNWRWPERVKMIAADGETDIYGTLYRPSDFDPEKSYPILEFHYPNPAYAWAPKEGFTGVMDTAMRAHAELGFIVVAIDGRGTPCRSKVFLDNSYGWFASASNIDDRVAGIQQLAKRYPYMDIQRVGIVGTRGAGPVYSMLENPDFYKVGVSFNFHDLQLFFAYMTERFEGLTQPPEQLARHYRHHLHQLSGKLLLIHASSNTSSEIDHTLRLVDKLAEAGKSVDLLIMKGEGGALPPYTWRKRMDYLVQHLLGVEPPKELALHLPNIY